jgi:hypothetical protein
VVALVSNDDICNLRPATWVNVAKSKVSSGPQRFTLTLQIFSLVGGRYSIEWDHVMAATFPACIAHKSLEICERCRLWQLNSPATPENSAAFWREEFKNSLF